MSDLEKLDIENTSYSMIKDMQNSASGSMVSWNAAWLRFDRQYKKYLLSICGKYGLRGAEAEDVVMRVEEKLRDQIKKYQPGKGKFRAWLWTITKNTSLDELKKASRKHEVAVDNVPELSGEDPNDGWDKEWQKYLAAEALEAMKSEVKPQKHQIFKLYCIQGKPAKEVASALDVSENVVYMTKNELMPLFEKLVKAVED
jgi:RNA polymerase sigma-70 factor (ECF subfamily)